MPAFTPEFVTFVFVLIIAALYVTVLVNAVRRRYGEEFASALLIAYALAAMVLPL